MRNPELNSMYLSRATVTNPPVTGLLLQFSEPLSGDVWARRLFLPKTQEPIEGEATKCQRASARQK